MQKFFRENVFMKAVLGVLLALSLFNYGCGVLESDALSVTVELDGELSTLFNSSGIRIRDGGSGADTINDVKVDSNGRFVLVGSTSNGGNLDLLVMRLLEDGSLDTDFSGDGVFTHDISGTDDEGLDVTILDGGEILVVGKSFVADQDGVIWKLTGAGVLDVGFNSADTPGYFRRHILAATSGVDVNNGDDEFTGVVESSDGDYIVVGAYTEPNASKAVSIGKIAADGSSVDTSFSGTDTDGNVLIVNGSGDMVPNHFIRDPDVGMYVTGLMDNSSGNTDVFIMKFEDSSVEAGVGFGSSGIVTFSNLAAANQNESGAAIALMGSNLAICATGNDGANDQPFLIVIDSVSGLANSNFNGGSPLQFTQSAGGGASSVSGIVVDKKSNIYCVGQSSNGVNNDLAIWRSTSAGNIDSRFNSTGFFSHNSAAGGNGEDLGNSAVMARCGKYLVVGGSSSNGADTDAAIWGIE